MLVFEKEMYVWSWKMDNRAPCDKANCKRAAKRQKFPATNLNYCIQRQDKVSGDKTKYPATISKEYPNSLSRKSRNLRKRILTPIKYLFFQRSLSVSREVSNCPQYVN